MTPARYAAFIRARLARLDADRAEAAIGNDWLVTGYRGAPVANPLADTARQARTAAVATTKAVGINLGEGMPGTNAGRALAGRRWNRSQ